MANSIVRMSPARDVVQRRGYAWKPAQLDLLFRNQMVVRQSFVPVGPNERVAEDEPLFIQHPDTGTRGSAKLDLALQHFGFERAMPMYPNPRALDVGACHCGFTSVLLRYGFNWVYAVDVGAIFPPKDPSLVDQIIPFPHTSIRDLSLRQIAEPIHVVTVDVSTSILSFLTRLAPFLHRDGLIVAMVKPNFEFPGLPILRSFLRNKGLDDQAIEQRSAFDFSLSTVEMHKLSSEIARVRHIRSRYPVSNRVDPTNRAFHWFELGAKLLGFNSMGRFPSPFPVELAWEEFFLLRPNWERLATWGLKPREG